MVISRVETAPSSTLRSDFSFVGQKPPFNMGKENHYAWGTIRKWIYVVGSIPSFSSSSTDHFFAPFAGSSANLAISELGKGK